MYYLDFDAVKIAVWSVLWCNYLTKPDEIAAWWPIFVQRYTLNVSLNKISHQCAKCHSGQIALFWQGWQWYANGAFSVWFIIFTIFLTTAYEKWKG
jgi:hypothetical protein